MKYNKLMILATVCGSLLWSACGKKDSANGSAELKTLKDSFSYSVGFNYGMDLKERELHGLNYTALLNGMKEAFEKDSNFLITPEMYQEIVGKYLEQNVEEVSKKNIAASKEFMSKKSKEDGVQKSESGLMWKILKEGDGRIPTITDTISAHVSIEMVDGKVFDDSRKYGEPVKFPISGAWPGMTEVLQQIKEGTSVEIYVPYELGFGKNPRMRGISPNSAIVYKLDLMEVL